MSNPLFEKKVHERKYPGEMDKCRNSIPYINHFMQSKYWLKSRMPSKRGPIHLDITHGTAVIAAGRVSDFNLTTDNPHLALTGELWDIYCDDLGANWPRYNGTALYYCSQWIHVIDLSIHNKENKSLIVSMIRGMYCKYSLTVNQVS